jgi:sulfur carrier protein
MTIICNGEPHPLAPSSTLLQLLQSLNCARPGVAVAVNDAVLSAKHWDTTELHEGDRILIIQAAQGG